MDRLMSTPLTALSGCSRATSSPQPPGPQARSRMALIPERSGRSASVPPIPLLMILSKLSSHVIVSPLSVSATKRISPPERSDDDVDIEKLPPLWYVACAHTV